jgi:F like protein
MGSDPIDPNLPAKIRAIEFVTQGEERIRRGWFRAITRWLDSIRDAVMRPTREAEHLPDPSGISSGDSWERLVDEEVVPAISQEAEIPWSAVTGGNHDDFTQDVDMIHYLEDVRNRMVRIPDEVYAQINRIILDGIDEGLSIPDIADNVATVLTANGSDQWPNRAVTVARTETIAAVNAGAFHGAAELARERGDTGAQKVWLSTLDRRTRHTHNEADAQRVPLFSPFVVGDYPLMFPGDPLGPAGEVINCRCTAIFVVADEEIDWTDRQFINDDPWADSEDWQDPSFRLGD